jgi:photosystem II stability/assembly factor-like uncharacterized protein
LPSNPNYGWICGQNTNFVLRTKDGGETWAASRLIGGTGQDFYESVHFVDSLHGFCSGPSGVFRTVDGGVS